MINEESVRLYDMYELVKNPEFNKLMVMKVGQIKNSELQDTIDAYNEEREKNFQLLTAKLTEHDTNAKKEAVYPPIYRFDFTQFGKDDWGVTAIDPYPKSHIPYFEPFPSLMILVIAIQCKDEMNTPKQFKAEYSEEYHTKADVWFTKMSENHIVGVLREEIAPEVVAWVDRAIDEGVMGDLNYPYQAMQYCLTRWPQLRTQFLYEFNTILLPKLQKIPPPADTEEQG